MKHAGRFYTQISPPLIIGSCPSGQTIIFWITLGLILLVGPSAHPRAESRRATAVRSATVPMEIRDNRAFVALRLGGPNGKSKVALFWVDSGGDTVFLGGPLARELGLQNSGAAFTGMGGTPSRFVTKPRLSIAGMEIDLTRVQVAASSYEGSRNAFAGVEAEGFLPATVLRDYDVVFDYPAHTFSLSQPGAAAHRGTPVPMLVNPQTGFARVEVGIDGKLYGFMLDTGAAYTGVSRTLMDQWIAEHPYWRHSVGAVGSAKDCLEVAYAASGLTHILKSVTLKPRKWAVAACAASCGVVTNAKAVANSKLGRSATPSFFTRNGLASALMWA